MIARLIAGVLDLVAGRTARAGRRRFDEAVEAAAGERARAVDARRKVKSCVSEPLFRPIDRVTAAAGGAVDLDRKD